MVMVTWEQPQKIYADIANIETSNPCHEVIVEVDSLVYDYETHRAYYYITMQTAIDDGFSDAFFAVPEDDNEDIICVKYSNFLHKDISLLSRFLKDNIMPILRDTAQNILIEPVQCLF